MDMLSLSSLLQQPDRFIDPPDFHKNYNEYITPASFHAKNVVNNYREDEKNIDD